MQYRYEKLDENGRIQHCPLNDYDGSITGKIVIGIKAWFDENPEERIKRGWIKHFYYEKPSEVKEDYEWNPASQILMPSTESVDEYTVKDIYHVIDKTEEMMVLEELLEAMNIYVPNGTLIVDDAGGAML